MSGIAFVSFICCSTFIFSDDHHTDPIRYPPAPHRYWSVPSLLPICRMLDEMETDLDKTTQRLDFVTQKTKEMIKRSGGKQNFLIIVALIVVAFILILLILYT